MAEVLTTQEAALYIKVTEKTVRELAREGKIPAQKVGREWRFLKSALDKWLEGNNQV
jgi:excisionase family DNA binding protein